MMHLTFLLALLPCSLGYVLSSSKIEYCLIDGELEPQYNGTTCKKKLVLNIAALEDMGPYWYEFDQYRDENDNLKPLGTTFLVALERSKTYVCSPFP